MLVSLPDGTGEIDSPRGAMPVDMRATGRAPSSRCLFHRSCQSPCEDIVLVPRSRTNGSLPHARRARILVSAMKYARLPMIALSLTCLLVPRPVLGMAGVDKCASPGTPVDARTAQHHGWPAGVRELLNSPLRGDGWHPWFSECPNDLTYYEFDVETPEDVEAVLGLLDGVDSAGVRVVLAPGEGRSHGSLVPSTNTPPVVFSIGSQTIIDEWFRRLSVDATGARVFGVHSYSQPPSAAPPTLTLHVGSDAVNLSRLPIPARFELVAQVSAKDEANAAYVHDLEAIRRYIADPYLQRRHRFVLQIISTVAVVIAVGLLGIVLGRRIARGRVRSLATSGRPFIGRRDPRRLSRSPRR